MSMESCSTISQAKAKDVGTVVELRCHPVSSGGTGSFVLGEDGNTDTLTVYYTSTVNGTSRVCTVSGTIDTTNGTDRVLDVNAGPNFNIQEDYPGTLFTASQGSITWVKTWADVHTFSTGDITGKIVSQSWTDYLYIEEDDRFSGIRVEKTGHGRLKGQRVNVTGSLATNSHGERYIAASTVAENGTGAVNPLGMTNKLLGGGDFAYSAGPPVSGQRGVVDGYGLNNIGVLVHAWGKVTELDSQWFKIEDGSNVSLTVAYPPFAYALNDYVTIAGVSSCEMNAGNMQRVLRPQPLTCTINQATGQADPTNTSPVNFIVIFIDPVTGFTADDVSLSGTAGGTKTITVTPTGSEGKVYNVAITGMTAGTLIASVPSGKACNSSGLWNYASTSTDNSVLLDNVAPSVPTGVAMDHVIPTSRKIRGHWNASTDSGSGLKDYLYQFYYILNSSEQNLTNWTATSETYATYTLWYDPGTTDGKTYYVRVKARDNVLNQSGVSTSSGVACQKARVGYLYYFADPVWEPPTDGFKGYIHTRLSSVTSANSTVMQYSQLQSFPQNLADFDILVVSCPNRNVSLTAQQMSDIAVWANGWHKRLVLVGDASSYRPTGQPIGYYNQRLNDLAQVVHSAIPAFKTSSGDIPSPYNIGTCYDFQYNRSWLLTGVTGLKFASPGWFLPSPTDWISRIDYTYVWIVERDLNNGGECLCIHDCNIFNPANIEASHSNFVRNFCTMFE